jgi:hypothetical protein
VIAFGEDERILDEPIVACCTSILSQLSPVGNPQKISGKYVKIWKRHWLKYSCRTKDLKSGRGFVFLLEFQIVASELQASRMIMHSVSHNTFYGRRQWKQKHFLWNVDRYQLSCPASHPRRPRSVIKSTSSIQVFKFYRVYIWNQ